jgi:transposase, IS30 family
MVEFPDDASMRISHEAIYQAIYVHPRGQLKRVLRAHLRTGRTGRQQRRTTRQRRGAIRDAVSIHARPEEVAGRLVPGHHEGDLIMGSVASNSAIGTVVERATGYLSLIHLPAGHDAETVADALATPLPATLPASMLKTLTWDRGTEMASHARLTRQTGIKVYFADPYAPWQRGSNENTNGLLREYFPKGTDLSIHSQQHLTAIAEQLNNRPRKRHGYLTPNQVMATLIAKDQHTGVATID